MRALVSLVFFACATLAPATSIGAPGETITVFAAASLTDALEEIGRRYRETNKTPVRFSFAASSTLARQIEAGAPAQIYCSASEDWMTYLAAHDLIEAEPRTSPITNRLVLVAPVASGIQAVDLAEPETLLRLLGAKDRLAVGDPAHVPAGIYARRALETIGLWRRLERRLARADNVRAALALVERGEVPFAIVYATDAVISKKVKVVAIFPPGAYPPIRYPLAIVKGQASALARELYAFIISEEGLRIFERHGFSRT